MATLDELVAATAAESSQLDSLITFVEGVEQQLKDALAGANLSSENQAKVDQVFANIQANAQKIASAISTPANP